MQRISSKDNRQLKFALRVRSGKEKERIFIEGLRLAKEAVRSGLDIDSLFVSEKFALELEDHPDLSASAKSLSDASILPENLFRNLADTKNPQGIVLTAKRPTFRLDDIGNRLKDAKLKMPAALLLNEVANPGNLGAVLRTAEAAGIAGVIITHASADAYSPAALRSSMGASFRIPVVEKISFGDAVNWARECNLHVYTFDASGQTSYDEADWSSAMMLVFGSESNGLETGMLDASDAVISLPMENQVESLNLAVSAGIVLFEAKRARKAQD